MTQFCPRTFVLLAFFFVIFANPVSAQDAKPKWKMETGDVFDIKLTQLTRIQSRVDQRVKEVDNELTLNVTWQVVSVSDDGGATVDMTIVSVQMKMASMPNGVGKSIDIDTSSDVKKKGAEADLLKQLKPLMGAVVTFELSPRGEIDNVVIPETTLESLRNAPGSMKLRKLLEAEGIEDLFGQAIAVLPPDPRTNQPWLIENHLETEFGNFLTTHTYEWTGNHTESDRQFADFDLKTSMTPDPQDKEFESKLTQFSGTGKLVFDIDGGYFTSSQSHNTMTTEKPYREKTITTTVSTDVEMKINKN